MCKLLDLPRQQHTSNVNKYLNEISKECPQHFRRICYFCSEPFKIDMDWDVFLQAR